jgi:hypothetical protein
LNLLQEFIMSSIVRSVLGATFLLTGASAAMAQSAYAPAPSQPAQTSAAPATTAPVNTPIAEQQAKPNPAVADKADLHGGHDSKSPAGARAFWDTQSNIY